MRPHQRQYEVHGKSVNLEKFRIHILEVIEDDGLTIPQIANALKTDSRRLMGVLYNMHAVGLVNINKDGRFLSFTKVTFAQSTPIYSRPKTWAAKKYCHTFLMIIIDLTLFGQSILIQMIMVCPEIIRVHDYRVSVAINRA